MDEKELIDALNYLADSKGYVAFHSEEDMDSVCKNCKADFCYHGKNDAHWCVYSGMQRAAVEIGKLLTRAETAEAIVDKYQTEIVPRLRERAERAESENKGLQALTRLIMGKEEINFCGYPFGKLQEVLEANPESKTVVFVSERTEE